MLSSVLPKDLPNPCRTRMLCMVCREKLRPKGLERLILKRDDRLLASSYFLKLEGFGTMIYGHCHSLSPQALVKLFFG